MKPFKIIVSGPDKEAKTAFIKTICDITVVSAGRSKGDGIQRSGGEKPVAMDVGRINVSRDMALYLFGCEARQRFDLLAETFAEGLLGLIVIVGSDDHDELKEAAGVLAYFEKFGDIPRVLAAAGPAGERQAELRKELEIDDDVPIVACDTSKRDSSKQAVAELLGLAQALVGTQTA